MKINRAPLVLIAIVGLLSTILVLDVWTPLGVAIWALYILPILIAFGFGRPSSVLGVAASATFLTFLGCYFSAAGTLPALALLNRLLGFTLIWITTLVLLQQRRLNSTLRRERDLSHSILNSLPGIYFLTDQHSRLLRWNLHLELSSGRTKSELRQCTLFDFVSPRDQSSVKSQIATALQVGQAEGEVDLCPGQGRHIPYQLITVRAEIDDTPCLLCMAIDLSARKLVEAEHKAAQAAAQRLAAIVDSSEDAILSTDLDNHILSWNRGAEKRFGYTADEMLGTSVARIIPPALHQEETELVAKIKRGECINHFQSQRLNKSGEAIDVSLCVSPLFDETGSLIGISSIGRDITVQKQYERELSRLSRLYAALSQVNQAIVWSPNRDDLLQKICQVLVADGGFRLAWIGWHDPESQQLVPVAVAGADRDSIRSMKIYADDSPEGNGPSGQAFRSGRPCVVNELLTNPASLPWRAELERCGYESAAAFPIRLQEQLCGVLSVYSCEPRFFQDIEVAMLSEAATDISFALDNFKREEQRQEIERVLRSEKEFSDTMIESMPGIVYFYDSTGRFLRWNRNFETVSGYTADEISQMHPRSFFGGDEQELLEQRIAEVFTHGESSVEASLLTRDGRTAPYFFTGRRVQFDGKHCLVGVGIDISARRQAEDQLAESERKYRELVEHANSIILRWNAEGRITFLNEFGQRFFGYSAAEILGQHVLDTIVPPAESSGRDLRALMDEICANPEAFGQNINENIRRDGTRVWIAWTNRIVSDEFGQVVEFLSIGTDITARKQAQEALREAEVRYRTLFEYAPDGIVISNPEGFYVDANASICNMLGFPREELIGLHASAIVADLEIAQIAPALDTINGHADHHREWQFRRKDGFLFPAEVIATMMPNGQIMGMIRDITERKEAELEREKRHQAEAADRIKSAFLATMSHELRTPLNSIIGFTGIILQGLAGPLNAEQRKQLEMVRTSARHLLALVNDVLDISKIEAGQFEVACEPFDLPRSISKVLSIMRPQAEKKGLALHSKVDPALGEAVGDERRFEQILLNLLSNAIKFTDQGEVLFTANLIDPAATEGLTGQAVVIQVSDTGIGIAPENLASLFQPFRQIDSGLSRTHDGTGLGLAICRRLADLMGGTVHAESVWEQGSTFTFTVPLRGLRPS